MGMRASRLLLMVAFGALAACGGDDPPVDPPPDLEWKEAFDAQSFGWLLNVWGPSPDDLWAVGGTPAEGKIQHWDGSAWAAMDTGQDIPLLNWAYGFSCNDITLVGNEGTILHYDGGTFTVQDTPTDQNLWGVWGPAPNDLWAVGGNNSDETDRIILHFDGTAWTESPIPMLQKANVRAFFKVWGTSSDNVYVVGSRGVVLHWEGSEWVEELVGASDDLISVWGTGPDHVVAVGGRGNGIVSRFDGSEWLTETLAPMPGLNGIFMRDPNVIHAVGVKGTIAKIDFDSLSFEQQDYDTELDLHAVFGDASGTLTAVGGSLASIQPPHQGVAIERNLATDE